MELLQISFGIFLTEWKMQREIEEIQDIYADMRGLRHDMKSHLESIAVVIRRISGKDKEELDDYIEKMETTVGRLDFTYSYNLLALKNAVLTFCGRKIILKYMSGI